MKMVHLRGRPVKTLFTEFALIGALGEVCMGLPRGSAFDSG
jgi:hypothetical protein